jgi:2-dehydro-3-deoxyphosphogluconate aldolase/(4S)-4-hydroxy-2-oxoglutarate aldolase
MMVYQYLAETGVIAIMRGLTGDAVFRVAQALYDGGIRLLEVTMNTDGALDAITRLKETYSQTMRIGAGTVTDRARAISAVNAGAEFVITPNLDYEVIRICQDKNIPIFPGVFTPTEMVNALNAGCAYIKLFPAISMGASYIKNILAPLDNVKIIAVGGVGLENAGDFFRAGVAGVGVGGNLCKVPADGDFSALTRTARELIGIYRKSLNS